MFSQKYLTKNICPENIRKKFKKFRPKINSQKYIRPENVRLNNFRHKTFHLTKIFDNYSIKKGSTKNIR